MNKQQQKEHKQQKFLKELSALTNKYKIAIDGCGCCGSPYLVDIKHEGSYEVSGTSDLKFSNLE